jgi:hypothetical protein
MKSVRTAARISKSGAVLGIGSRHRNEGGRFIESVIRLFCESVGIGTRWLWPEPKITPRYRRRYVFDVSRVDTRPSGTDVNLSISCFRQSARLLLSREWPW